jgi:hypothetical protein
MAVYIHPHALDRMSEPGATGDEVTATVENGERFAAKFGRVGFHHNFTFGGHWNGRPYGTKQVEAYAVEETDGWLVITVIVKFF